MLFPSETSVILCPGLWLGDKLILESSSIVSPVWGLICRKLVPALNLIIIFLPIFELVISGKVTVTALFVVLIL